MWITVAGFIGFSVGIFLGYVHGYDTATIIAMNVIDRT